MSRMSRISHMSRYSVRSSIVISALLTALAASAAFAGADIVTCVDRGGKVTLTDAQCRIAVPIVVAPDNGAVQAGAPRANTMLSRDVETLKAARLSMQVLDGAAATVRRQSLARWN